MKTEIEIIRTNYSTSERKDWNMKVLYSKCGKTYLAYVYVVFFNKEIFKANPNPKESVFLVGFLSAIKKYANDKNWLL